MVHKFNGQKDIYDIVNKEKFIIFGIYQSTYKVSREFHQLSGKALLALLIQIILPICIKMLGFLRWITNLMDKKASTIL